MKPNRLLPCILFLCLLAGLFSSFPVYADSNAVFDCEMLPTERFLETLAAVEALEKSTEDFYGTSDTFGYTVRYIRSARYSDFTWDFMIGEPDAAYVSAMREYADLQTLEAFLLLSGKDRDYVMDFVHMAAAADAKLDFAGWAGDLITLADEIETLADARAMIASDHGHFDMTDFRADIDAKNLLALSDENGGSLAGAMRFYYLEGGLDTAVTDYLLRETGLSAEKLNTDAIEHFFYSRLTGDVCQKETKMLAELYGVWGDIRLEYACRAFAEELFRCYCGETLGHNAKTVMVSAPTCTDRGCVCHLCLTCGEIWETDFTPAAGHQPTLLRTQPTDALPGIESTVCGICGLHRETWFDNATAGDMDFNGTVNARDYLILKRGIEGSYTMTLRQMFLADLNGDGVLNAADYLLLHDTLL